MDKQDKLLIFYAIKKNKVLNFIKLGEIIYNLIPEYPFLYRIYRKLNIEENQGEKALNCYIAFKLGKEEK